MSVPQPLKRVQSERAAQLACKALVDVGFEYVGRRRNTGKRLAAHDSSALCGIVPADTVAGIP